MLRPRRAQPVEAQLKVATREAKPFAEINSGVLTKFNIKDCSSGLQRVRRLTDRTQASVALGTEINVFRSPK